MAQYYIWCFPGTGKSSVSQSVPDVLDADSRLFQFIGATPQMLHNTAARARTAPNPEYPDNYFHYIENAGSTYVLLNCHVSLLPRIPSENLLLIYPDISLKDEYLCRYRDRGDSESFLSYMDESFADMVRAIESYPCRKLRITDEHTNEALTEEQALSDVRQYLEQQSDRYFADRRTTKEEVLADTELLGELAGRHHCTVNMFDGERESSYMNACDYEPGINMDAVYLMSGSVKKEFFRGTPAECEKFCEDNNWSYVDENRFEWDLALKSEVGSIKPSLTQQIQDAAAQTDKGVQQDRPSLVQMPGTQDPDWGKKHWGEGR